MSKERLETIKRHLENSPATKLNKNAQEEQNAPFPKQRHNVLKWNGWGYKDTKILFRDGRVKMTGNRYPICNKNLPAATEHFQKVLNIREDVHREPQPQIPDEDLPIPTINEDFLQGIENLNIDYSFNPQDRLYRAHGMTLRETYMLRESLFERIPDLVLFPKCHNDVVKIVQLADKYNVVIIPFGGGTCVSQALACPSNEARMIVSLDTSQMNRILWIDKETMMAHAEAGIIGIELEKQLEQVGLCIGHEPDSWELSTLGGWVATRASGMKKSNYGNIEDMVVHIRFVTPRGVVERNCLVPRLSSGPDIHHLILGSEGTLGVVTEVTFKVRPIPESKIFGSIIFPDYETGIKYLRELARRRIFPTSIRLMDNDQFLFGHALKPEDETFFGPLMNYFKRIYVTKFKGFDPNKMSVATLMIEGKRKEVEALEKSLYEIALNYGGYPGGEENGRSGYTMTYVIAYIRDTGLDYGIVSESFETSVPWDRVYDLTINVKNRIHKELVHYGITKFVYVTSRVTQSYDAGACVYFYMAFPYFGLENPVDIFEEVEAAARDEILANGGSISHHHGVGKLRKQFLKKSVSEVGLGMLKSVKHFIDPKNIFNNGNLMIDNN